MWLRTKLEKKWSKLRFMPRFKPKLQGFREFIEWFLWLFDAPLRWFDNNEAAAGRQNRLELHYESVQWLQDWRVARKNQTNKTACPEDCRSLHRHKWSTFSEENIEGDKRLLKRTTWWNSTDVCAKKAVCALYHHWSQLWSSSTLWSPLSIRNLDEWWTRHLLMRG